VQALRSIAVIGLLVMTIGAVATLPVDAATGSLAKNQASLAKKVKIKVGDNYFKPKKITVTVGDTVTFKWIGTAVHDVKVKKGPEKFGSKKQASGKFSRVVLQPGDYKIVCTLHPGMVMKLTALAPPPVTTTAPPAP
jgi:plastocyanin